MLESTTPKKKSNSSLLSYELLTTDQRQAINRLYEHDHTLLIAGMGAGKTVICLTALFDLLEQMFLQKVLILAPVKVCNTVWATECQKWEHLAGYADDITLCTGTKAQREKALKTSGKVVVTNFENIPWLVDQPEFQAFDGLVVDELTKLKGGGVSFKRLRKWLSHFHYRVGMTGTLVSENLQSIFYQAMVVDAGVTFGKNKEKFLRKFFYPLDFNGYKWEAKPDSERTIVDMFKHYTYHVPDYTHQLPKLGVWYMDVPLPPPARAVYDDMAKGMTAEGVVAENMAVQVLKLQQIASGFLYGENKNVIDVHDEKLRAIETLVEKVDRKTGKTAVTTEPVIIVYQFQEELSRLQSVWPDAPVIGGGVSSRDTARIVSDWNKGRLNVLLLHPKSAGHGLNLAAGGCKMIWFSPVWSRDLFDQTIARLWRRGQKNVVRVYVMTGLNTVDELINERIDSKAGFMSRFIQHLQQCNDTLEVK